jgi:hypothetical protein
MRNECGSENVVVDKIRNAAMKTKIQDETEPTKGPVEVLVSWSEKILKDFRSRNVEIPPATDLVSLIWATSQCTVYTSGGNESAPIKHGDKAGCTLTTESYAGKQARGIFEFAMAGSGCYGQNQLQDVYLQVTSARPCFTSKARRVPDSSELCVASPGLARAPARDLGLKHSMTAHYRVKTTFPLYGAAADATTQELLLIKARLLRDRRMVFHAEGKLKKAEVGFKFESLERPPFIVTETKKFRDAMELLVSPQKTNYQS